MCASLLFNLMLTVSVWGKDQKNRHVVRVGCLLAAGCQVLNVTNGEEPYFGMPVYEEPPDQVHGDGPPSMARIFRKSGSEISPNFFENIFYLFLSKKTVLVIPVSYLQLTER